MRRLKDDGADVVKVFASASIREGGGLVMTPAQLEAVCTEAQAVGLRTVVHAYGTDGLTASIEAGCGGIEHGNRYDDAVIELMAERGTYLDPTSTCCGPTTSSTATVSSAAATTPRRASR